MEYFKDADGKIYAFDSDQVAQGYADGLTPLTEQELYDILNPPSTYQKELAEINARWQKKVDGYNRAFAVAALSDGPTEESKKLDIRAEYELARSKNTSERSALKAKYGM